MQFQEKALYNLLRINWLEDPSMEVKSWQVENYRDLPLHEIFKRLKSLAIPLNEEMFLLYAQNCETPEELADCLWVKEEDNEGYDQAYLLLFELWRRLLPEKQSLSIFCDELDWNIELYDKDELENEETLQGLLEDLEDILDEHVEAEGEPKEVFQLISQYCAHDLENFIYDYISEQIDLHNELYASELLDGFSPYVLRERWFDFLRARLLAVGDIEKANTFIESLLEVLQEEPDLPLLLQIANFLIHTEESKLFLQAVKQALSLINKEEEFQELIRIIADYYRLLDKEQEEMAVKKILDKRKNLSPDATISLESRKELKDLLHDLDRSEV